MAFQYRYSTTNCFLMTLIANNKTVNCFSLSIFNNCWFFLMSLIANSKTVNSVSLSIFKNLLLFNEFNSKTKNGQLLFTIDIQKPIVRRWVWKQQATRSMVFHYRYSKTYGLWMILIAKSKTVNGCSLSIFKNDLFSNDFDNNKENCQWLFNIDIQTLLAFEWFW